MLIQANALQIPLQDNSVQCIITSPPYLGLRSYLPADSPFKAQEIGAEPTLDAYIANLVAVGRELWRVLRPDGIFVLNLGDSYASGGTGGTPSAKSTLSRHGQDGRSPYLDAMGQSNRREVPDGLKPKDLMMVPARVALALQAAGWYVRSEIPWIKKNCMPGSQTDRPTTGHEHLFLLAKSPRYYWDQDAIRGALAPTSLERWNGDRAASEQDRNSTEIYPRADGHIQTVHKIKSGDILNPAGRTRRTTDWWFESLDRLIAEQRAYLAHLEQVRSQGGILLDEDGDPLALQVNTKPYSGSHFAVFPPDLVEPFILAGTSQRGCCPACGAPWTRVVERQLSGVDECRPDNGMPGRSGNGLTRRRAGDPLSVTTAWQPSCTCEEQPGQASVQVPFEPGGDTGYWAPAPVPCVVLDPFCGSGTVLQVALEHRRRAIGLDLNPAYLHELATERTAIVQPVMLPA